MQDEKKAEHTIDRTDAELATIILDDIKGFFPEPGVKFKLLAGGSLVECAVRKAACVAQQCPVKDRHEHTILDCPSLSSLVDVQKGNRLVFSKKDSLYIVEEAVYFTRK